MISKFKNYRLSYGMFKWWLIFEILKLVLWIFIFVNPKVHMFYIPWIWFIFTLIIFKKSFAIFRALVSLSLNEEDLQMKHRYEKVRNNLFLIFILDFFPFIPLIQAIFRCRYYRLITKYKR